MVGPGLSFLIREAEGRRFDPALDHSSRAANLPRLSCANALGNLAVLSLGDRFRPLRLVMCWQMVHVECAHSQCGRAAVWMQSIGKVLVAIKRCAPCLS